MTPPLRIKICGITTENDARQAALLGADAIGLNFYASSPRYVKPAAVPGILTALPPFVDPVGVYVGLRLAEMGTHAETFGLRSVQWHGANEEREPGIPPRRRLIAAFAVCDRDDVDAITRYLDACHALNELPAAILVDARVSGQFGGTGKTAPWALLADFRPPVPLLLAGGLTPDNVAEAVRIVRPHGVDVASGVESSPGIKDAEKIRRFIDNARNAAAGL